uniref:hypothetical protein n=1 Tax=Acinetobacter baumannii TaxID=470 RepID=UPI003398675E
SKDISIQHNTNPINPNTMHTSIQHHHLITSNNNQSKELRSLDLPQSLSEAIIHGFTINQSIPLKN